MALTKSTAEIMAPPETVYDVVSDPTLLPDWDATYEAATPIRPDRDEGPSFDARRLLANRDMLLVCHVDSALPATRFAFTCSGGEGEQIEEVFDLAPAQDGAATAFTRQLTFKLPGRALGAVDETVFDEAVTDRSVEQAFARLNAMLAPRPSPPRS